ncbi:type 1 fimbrial protein [Salmonella enterica subsp. diarizonae]|nr:F7-2 fimbrial protein [Salmonella enterica subsp. diarizonae]EDX6217655.1 type 1 fimbrial protein [Salmonella enterica subsp. diarizonae]
MIKTVMAGAVAMTLVSFGASAANQGVGTINFKGSVIDAPCGIAPESADQTVNFDQISKAHLNKGGISKKQFVDIKLVNCEFGTAADTTPLKNNLSVAFSGLTVSTDGTGLGLSDTNAVVKMSGPDGKPVKFDGTASTNIAKLQNGDNTLRYQAWVQKGAAAVTEGEFSTVANFALAYN